MQVYTHAYRFYFMSARINPNSSSLISPELRVKACRPTQCTLTSRGVRIAPGSTRRLKLGPWTQVSKMTPEFTGRVHGPWTRPVNTGSVCRPLVPQPTERNQNKTDSMTVCSEWRKSCAVAGAPNPNTVCCRKTMRRRENFPFISSIIFYGRSL